MRFPALLAVAVSVFSALVASCASPASGCPPGASCPPPPPPKVTFATTINGRYTPRPKDGAPPSYHVRPGEYLLMRVAVTVPRHVRVTALWFGISVGSWGWGPKGPTGMNPILAHTRQPLSAGEHTFGLRWRIPAGRSGASLYLVTNWSSHQPPASVARAIATLALK
jgi:hypothetical protein